MSPASAAISRLRDLSRKVFRKNVRANAERASYPARMHARAAVPLLEQLEPRVMLNGVTIITHGFMADFLGTAPWLSEMANETANRIALEYNKRNEGTGAEEATKADVAQFRLEIDHSWGSPFIMNGGELEGWNGYDLGGSIEEAIRNSLDGEVVITLDWQRAAGLVTPNPLQPWIGSPEITTQAVAEEVSDYLLSSDVGGLLLSSPIHLIGHSRGGSLVGALAEDLGQHNIWVDQTTFLDPHPMYGPPKDWGDSGMTVPENVVFADTYYREGSGIIPNGTSVEGALNVQLDEDFFHGISQNGYGVWDEHSDVHLWYHGTIDTVGGFSDGVAGVSSTTAPHWYSSDAYETGSPEPSRDEGGYNYSRIVDGDRPLSGLYWKFNGGTGTNARSEVAPSGAQWANIGYLSSPSSIVQGDDMTIGYYRQTPYGGDANVTFYLDDDQNFHNGYRCALGSEVTASEVVPVKGVGKVGQDSFTTSGGVSVASGQYYVVGVIQQNAAFGLASTPRHFYSAQSLTVTAQADPNTDLSPDPYEPDDTPANANEIAVNGGTETHSIHSSDDKDWFHFTGPWGQSSLIDISVEAGDGSLLYVALYQSVNDGMTPVTYSSGEISTLLGPGQSGWVMVEGPSGTVEDYTFSVNATAIDLGGDPTGRASVLVTSTDDVTDSTDGVISLREAIANTFNIGYYEITFDPQVFSSGNTTIKLTQGSLGLQRQIVIDASAVTADEGLIIDAADMHQSYRRAFNISENVTVAMTALTVTGGLTTGDGGGIKNDGFLTLTNCNINGNESHWSGGGGLQYRHINVVQ